MSNQRTDNNKVDQQAEPNPLMEAYNPPPLTTETPAHFYWEVTPQEQASDGAVQSAFEN